MSLPPRPPPIRPAGFATLLALIGTVSVFGVRVRAGEQEAPSMPVPTPKAAEPMPVAKDAPATPPIDLLAPKTIATATFALG